MAVKFDENILAQELVSDDPEIRIKCVEIVQDYIQDPEVSEKKYQLLWKGLFYSLWVADQTEIQIDLSLRISKLIHVLADLPLENFKNWVKANYFIFHREWSKVDYWRSNKFLKLARFCLMETYSFLKNKNYDPEYVTAWNEILQDNILNESIVDRSLGLTLHIIQVYVDVITDLKNIRYENIKTFLEPMLELLSNAKHKAIKSNISDNIFKEILTRTINDEFKAFNIKDYSSLILKKASSKNETAEANRKFMYDIFKEYKVHKDREYIEPEYVEEEQPINGHQSSPKALSKKEKKKLKKQQKQEQEKAAAAAQESNGIHEEEAPVSKKKKTNAKEEPKTNKNKEKIKSKQAQKAALQEEEEEEETEFSNGMTAELHQQDAEHLKRDKKLKAKQLEKEKLKMKQVNEAIIDEDDEDFEEEEYQDQLDSMLSKNLALQKTTARTKQNLRSVEDYDEEEDEELQELPEDWNEEDEDGWEITDEDDEDSDLNQLSEEEYEQLLQKLSVAPTFLLSKKQLKKFWDNVNNQYYDTISQEKGKKSPHARNVDFDSKKVQIKEFVKTKKMNAEINNHIEEDQFKPILKKQLTYAVKKNANASSNANAAAGAGANKKQKAAKKGKKAAGGAPVIPGPGEGKGKKTKHNPRKKVKF